MTLASGQVLLGVGSARGRGKDCPSLLGSGSKKRFLSHPLLPLPSQL